MNTEYNIANNFDSELPDPIVELKTEWGLERSLTRKMSRD